MIAEPNFATGPLKVTARTFLDLCLANIRSKFPFDSRARRWLLSAIYPAIEGTILETETFFVLNRSAMGLDWQIAG